ncbi:ZZ-type zinc finger-containing protein 3 [Mortierella sp. GBA30]|nr:ZZ-type zinc finger-containing protein 3 [Mortierella sp. GBA30]
MSLIKPEPEAATTIEASPAPLPTPTPLASATATTATTAITITTTATSTAASTTTANTSVPDASSITPNLDPITNQSPQPIQSVQPTQPTQSTPSTPTLANGIASFSKPGVLANPTSALERGPLGLAPEEEEWVKDRMEYALYEYKWQLSQVPKDIHRLQNLKEMHMEDPIEFLRQVKSREFRYPEAQKTLPAPTIEWNKYQFPPANPVVPTKPQSATFLSSVSFSTGHERSSSKVVSLTSSSRSRAGSPSYERLRTVKDTAKQLGIQVAQIHQYHHNHQHQQQHQHHQHHHHTYQHPSQDTGVVSARAEINGVDGSTSSDTKGLPPRQIAQEANQVGRDYSRSPGVTGRGHNNNDMEGTLRESQTTAGGHRARSATVPEGIPVQQGGSSYYPAVTTQQQPQLPVHQLQPLQENRPMDLSNMANTSTITSFTDRVIDHGTGYSTLQQYNSLSVNNNITYNHMSGTMDVKPSITTTTAGPVKGKAYAREGSGTRDETKPPLYNIPWSDEEQRLLEKLLDEYPDEPVAAQRFQKISAAMGTRTPKQVASRVQKYFIKLVKAGLEAPGRMNYSLETSKPKSKTAGGAGAASNAKGKKRKDGPAGAAGGEGSVSKSKAGRPRKKDTSAEAGGSGSGSNKKQRPKSLLGSGFGRTSGTQYLQYAAAPTVYMSDEDDEESVQDMLAVSYNNNNINSSSSSSAQGIDLGHGVATHMGYYCDACGVDPILGVRHSCLDCDEFGGTDLCGPCFNLGTYQNDHHVLSHRFQAFETAEAPLYSNDSQPASAASATGAYYS